MHTPEEVLDFWFGPIDENGRVQKSYSQRWFTKSDATDDLIRQRFEPLIQQVANGYHVAWSETARGRLALIITQDQFTRNIYRDTPQAFAHDALARWLAQEGLAQGHDQELTFIERTFFYLPFEHAEDQDMQVESIRLYQQLHDAAVEKLTAEHAKLFANHVEYAHRHKAIIDRFGRYPHRNAILQRASTPEELAFLEGPGSSF